MTVQFRMLADAQLDEIHLATLALLERTGVRVHEKESRDLLQEAGCRLADETRVHFPAKVVENAIQDAPSRIVLSSRTGQPSVFLEDRRSFFGTGSDLPNTIDLESGERRLSLLSDVEAAARLVDALPNLDFLMSMALPSDVPAVTSDRHSFLAMMKNSTKPIVFTAWDEAGLGDIYRMAETVAGGARQLQHNPFLLAYLEPTSPLQHTEVVLRKLLLAADRGLPVVYAPGAVEGASAPVTSAGSLVMGNAESLSGLVIAQLKRKGTPVVIGSGNGPLDMRTMVATYGSPEFMHNNAGLVELAHYYYHLPVWGFAGCSDSKRPDAQAGFESAMWILWTALSGANLIHDVGYLESGLTCSYEMIVLSDEMIGLVRRLIDGIQLTPEALALDVMDEVGPGGDFLTTDHTTKHFREVWYPRVFDRRPYESWAGTGKKQAPERAREIARQAITSHKPTPLSDDTLESLAAIISDAEGRAEILP